MYVNSRYESYGKIKNNVWNTILYVDEYGMWTRSHNSGQNT